MNSYFTMIAHQTRAVRGVLLCSAALLLSLHTPLQAAETELEKLTATELRSRVAAGTSTILIPIGGTEQSGPYLALGKHNLRGQVLAQRIAQSLGNAVVAPVLAYVPEGAIHPPTGHMRFAGTISIPEAAFEALLEGVARSFKQHGFHDVVLLGDHGGYQKNLEHVASRLNREWAHDPQTRVHALPEYYQAVSVSYVNTLRQRGFSMAEIGTHAGLADTAVTLALVPELVRSAALAHAGKPSESEGVYGDPRRATDELGQLAVKQIIETSVAAIKRATVVR
ncbi:MULTISPECIES: creatininase family protein [unclassified Undibacterium]|uniref:creatininase family protein n=1 Tax=unclassified Undibacterium TaxID=2630295 RepID=UPI002AC95FA2|nr:MULTISPECIES: creatininase family protein [unclassified Undibacterium]MEB0137461.1 creatininase family protein [Undibacterium sp. CCC2.1]MEB0170874.1 creatininase family protein [Undibacterium sp. CCC1.1]MEB0174826.1 creatininase family protein [Undibacterium sp. CCC3.4]MEB0214162.1 creatininase family protein [Undibacterium sp. 5I2]WPX44474.1 creatininase family protein [Undibacterium sp. CCC3.4]